MCHWTRCIQIYIDIYWPNIYIYIHGYQHRYIKIFSSNSSRTHILLFFLMLFIFETERNRAWMGWGRERGRHRIGSRLQALSHQPRAWRGARTHELWDRGLSWCRTLNRLSHPGAPERTFFLSAHRTFSNIDHILGHKTALHKYKRIEIIPCIFSDHNAQKLGINHKKKIGKPPNAWRLQNFLLNKEWVHPEIKKEIKNHMEAN